jgi:hypothetical protein
MLTLLMCVIIFACVALLHIDSLWSNAIRLINVVTAALLAMNFFEPIAGWLEGNKPDWSYFCDFFALWGLFIIFSAIFRNLTDRVSHVNVQFSKNVERVGSGIISLWIGWILVCFTMTTLHTAPLGKNFLGDSFQPEERMVFGLAPDRQWLAFTQKMSEGAYSRSASGPETTVFDPKCEFLIKYASRRAALEGNIKQGRSFDNVPKQ